MSRNKIIDNLVMHHGQCCGDSGMQTTEIRSRLVHNNQNFCRDCMLITLFLLVLSLPSFAAIRMEVVRDGLGASSCQSGICVCVISEKHLLKKQRNGCIYPSNLPVTVKRGERSPQTNQHTRDCVDGVMILQQYTPNNHSWNHNQK